MSINHPMFNKYDSSVNATIHFVQRLNVDICESSINETLKNHPNCPSLLSISDSLKSWNIPNGAGKIDAGEIDQIPTPFLAFTYNDELQFSIVTDVSGSEVKSLYKNNYKRLVTEPKEEFVKKWNGVYLIAKPTHLSGEEDYSARRRKFRLSRSYYMVGATVLLLFFIAVLFQLIDSAKSKVNFSILGTSVVFAVTLFGLMVTSILLWYEVDKQNLLLKRVCSSVVKTNCNAVLTSSASKVFNLVSWSEVGFFYFAGSFLILAVANEYFESSIYLLSVLNIIALCIRPIQFFIKPIIEHGVLFV